MVGHSNKKTIRLKCKVLTKTFTILDGGSTYKFTQNRVVKILGLSTVPTPNFYVMVGNGGKLWHFNLFTSSGCIRNTYLSHQFLCLTT